MQGCPKEVLISVACITAKNDAGVADHVKQNVKKLIAPSQVAVLCTDTPAVYVGEQTGMYLRLYHDKEFSDKLIFLPDLCHKVENLMFNTRPQWAFDAGSLLGYRRVRQQIADSSNSSQNVIKEEM